MVFVPGKCKERNHDHSNQNSSNGGSRTHDDHAATGLDSQLVSTMRSQSRHNRVG
jgi:hypothetical protein